jgi:4-carboxymuconolactone decarboxylase
MTRQAFARGMKTRRKVLGDEWVDRAVKKTTPFNAEFQDLITRYAWDEIWNRTRLTRKERRILVIGTLLALGRWEEFRLHVLAAVQSGDLAVDDVKEILLQQVIYCGVPAANTAFREAREVIDGVSSGKKSKKR